MSIRLRQLRTFKAIVDQGSVSDAAVALGLTQSSVSKSIAGFEAELGFHLFDRVGRRLSLSAQGRAFLTRTGSAIDLLEGIEAAADDIRDNQTARLRLTAIGPILMSGFLPRVLVQFSQDLPDIRLSVETKSRAEVEDWVANGHTDLAFTLLPIQRGRLKVREIASVKAVVMLPMGHPLAALETLSPKDLEPERIVMPRASVRLRTLVEAGFHQAGIALNPWIETSNAVSTADLVTHGNGVAVIDPFTVTGVALDKVVIRPWKPDILLSYGLIWSGERSHAPFEQRLAAHAEAEVENLSQMYPWFETS